jgi:hypothetical protein
VITTAKPLALDDGMPPARGRRALECGMRCGDGSHERWEPPRANVVGQSILEVGPHCHASSGVHEVHLIDRRRLLG